MTSSGIELVGWDEARGRPIYRRHLSDTNNPTRHKARIAINKHESVGEEGSKRATPFSLSSLTDSDYNSIDGMVATDGRRKTSTRRPKTRVISLSPTNGQGHGPTNGRDSYDDDIVIASDEGTSPCPSPLVVKECREQHTRVDRRDVARSGKIFDAMASWKRRKKWYGNGTKMSFTYAYGIFYSGAFGCESKTLDAPRSLRVESAENDGEEGGMIISETWIQHGDRIPSVKYNQEEDDFATPEKNTVERTKDLINEEKIDPMIEPPTMQESESDRVKEENYQGYSKYHLLHSDSFPSSRSSERGRHSIDTLQTVGTLQHEIDEQRCGSDENDSSTFDSIYESPLSPNIHARRDSIVDKVASINLMFDDEEFRAITKEKRRSYGDSKPVWTSNMIASRNESDGIVGLVGWDDAKCRPIYRATSRLNIPSKDASSWADESSKKSDPRPLEGSNVNYKRHQKKVYATLFKKTGLSRAMRDEMNINSPSPMHDPTNANPFRFSPEEASCIRTLSNRFSHFENGDNDEKINRVDSRPQSSRGINISEESLDDNYVSADCVQPHSKSSLASARAFFRYLDSNHILTVLDLDEPSAAQKNNL
jgi:hypothetical protein